jgi:hypothetical protein
MKKTCHWHNDREDEAWAAWLELHYLEEMSRRSDEYHEHPSHPSSCERYIEHYETTTCPCEEERAPAALERDDGSIMIVGAHLKKMR